MFKERLKAFSVHLSISLAIFAVLLYLILFHWYPQPFFAADGGWQGIRIVVGVDLVLGPLMTFIVYRKGKPGLKFDLTMIALVQLTALTWGVHITYSERPVLITYSQFGFYTVTADQLEKTGLKIGDLKRFEQGSVLPMAYVDVPSDPDQREAVFVRSLKTGQPVYLMSKLYRPLDAQNIEKIRSDPIDVRANVKPDRRAWHALQRFLAKHDAPLDRYIYLPLSCRYRNLVAIVDPKTIDIVGAVALTHARLQFKRMKPHKKTDSPKPKTS